MKDKTRLLALAASLMTASCGRGSATENQPSAAVCYDLAVAAQIAVSLRQHVTAQYAATDKAMVKWAQWEKKQITPEQDGTGEYSGAGQVAFAHERTGSALCESVRLVDAGMIMTARESKLQWSAAEDRFDRFTCDLKASPKDPDAATRKASAREWEERSRSAREGEDLLVNECSERAGTPRPAVRLPPMLLVDE